jgi:hypothetical protein
VKHADARPRIHIWPRRDGSAEWATGPVGLRRPSLSPGACVDAAIESVRPRGLVVIVKAEQQS